MLNVLNGSGKNNAYLRSQKAIVPSSLAVTNWQLRSSRVASSGNDEIRPFLSTLWCEGTQTIWVMPAFWLYLRADIAVGLINDVAVVSRIHVIKFLIAMLYFTCALVCVTTVSTCSILPGMCQMAICGKDMDGFYRSSFVPPSHLVSLCSLDFWVSWSQLVTGCFPIRFRKRFFSSKIC